MVAPRIIKKYPNRRLYDTETSSYITLAEVKELVEGVSTLDCATFAGALGERIAAQRAAVTARVAFEALARCVVADLPSWRVVAARRAAHHHALALRGLSIERLLRGRRPGGGEHLRLSR